MLADFGIWFNVVGHLPFVWPVSILHSAIRSAHSIQHIQSYDAHTISIFAIYIANVTIIIGLRNIAGKKRKDMINVELKYSLFIFVHRLRHFASDEFIANTLLNYFPNEKKEKNYHADKNTDTYWIGKC